MVMKVCILWNLDFPKQQSWPQEIPSILLPTVVRYTWVATEFMAILWLVSDEQNATGPQLCIRVPYDVEAFYSAWCVCSVSDKVVEMISDQPGEVPLERLLHVSGIDQVFDACFRCCDAVRQGFQHVEQELKVAVESNQGIWKTVRPIGHGGTTMV